MKKNKVKKENSNRKLVKKLSVKERELLAYKKGYVAGRQFNK